MLMIVLIRRYPVRRMGFEVLARWYSYGLYLEIFIAPTSMISNLYNSF